MTDDEIIAQAIAEARGMSQTPDLWGRARDEAECLASLIFEDSTYRAAVARHLLSRDPESVRVPMKGKVG